MYTSVCQRVCVHHECERRLTYEKELLYVCHRKESRRVWAPTCAPVSVRVHMGVGECVALPLRRQWAPSLGGPWLSPSTADEGSSAEAPT